MKAFWWIIALVVTILVALLGWFLLRGRSKPTKLEFRGNIFSLRMVGDDGKSPNLYTLKTLQSFLTGKDWKAGISGDLKQIVICDPRGEFTYIVSGIGESDWDCLVSK